LSRTTKLLNALEWPIAFLALLVVPALVLEDRATDPHIRETARLVNWIVWLAFCAEFGIRWAAARTTRFLRTAWFDLLLILISPPFFVPDYLQSTRSLRVLRILRLVRLVRAGAVAGIGLRLFRKLIGRRKFHYTALVAVAVICMGALGVFLFEKEQNKSIGSIGDALWWAVVTATTVGYGDVSPVTTEGRIIAVVLMLTGIGVIGIFTATIAAFFFEEQEEQKASELAAVTARLESLERKMDLLLERERKEQ